MNPLTLLFRLPLLPLEGLVKLASIIKDSAEQEMASPATIRRELEQAEQARAAGEISDEQAAEFEEAALAEFARARRAATAPGDRG